VSRMHGILMKILFCWCHDAPCAQRQGLRPNLVLLGDVGVGGCYRRMAADSCRSSARTPQLLITDVRIRQNLAMRLHTLRCHLKEIEIYSQFSHCFKLMLRESLLPLTNRASGEDLCSYSSHNAMIRCAAAESWSISRAKFSMAS
jgi:hypothetical protein